MGAALHEITGPPTARRRGSLLRLAPVVTVALFLLPILAGLIGTVLPAFGYLPAIGGRRFSLVPWRELYAYPGFGSALRLSITTGVSTTILALVLAVGCAALGHGRPAFSRLQSAMAPILAAPHSAVAIGFAFLIAPSGWLVRLVSPWATGFDRPPDFATTGDAWGVALAAGLLLKEIPYLMLMTLAALNQVPAGRHLAIGRSLGYGPGVAWIKLVLPQIYPQLRLPVYAVLAFSLSVVDVALILGPGNPPPLSVLAVRWFADPDVLLYFPAAAAAALQLVVVIAGIALWRAGETGVACLGRWWIGRGGRGLTSRPGLRLAFGIVLLLTALGLLSLIGMAVWSFATLWRFPAALPDGWTFATWSRQARIIGWPLSATCVIGVVATLVAVLLSLACLENEQRRGMRVTSRSLWLLYVPLLIPQIAFLFGAEVLAIALDVDGTFGAVIWAHLLFVLPYVFLSLADPWRALDPRYARTAAGLGASPARIFFQVKLPLLLRPILIAAAVGFAVSVAQYLPTIFAGNGRVTTLTTQAVTLSAGGDRRVIGVYAFLQAALPLLVYGGAIALPAVLYRQRRDLAISR
jgi:putative thiamine transport system permease protein